MQQDNSSNDINEEALEKKEELSSVISETFKGGQAIVYARIHFFLKAKTVEEVEHAATTLINVLSRLNSDGLKEEIIAPSLFLTCLPLNFDYSHENYIRRTKGFCLIIYLTWCLCMVLLRGTKTPAQFYLNRRGEPVFIDFFDSETNPHGIVIGASGAGKSFLDK